MKQRRCTGREWCEFKKVRSCWTCLILKWVCVAVILLAIVSIVGD